MKKAVVLALAAIMVLGVAGAAFANIEAYDGSLYAPGRWQASNSTDPVEVKATVNPKITLTVETPDAAQSVDFGAVDPGATYGGKTVTLTVDSNKQFDLTATPDVTGFGTLTLTRSLANQADHAKGAGIVFTDNYGIDVPVDADPIGYTATVTYSVVQD